MNKLFKPPWLVLNILVLLSVFSFILIGVAAITLPAPEGGMAGVSLLGCLLGFFLMGAAIAMLAIIGGIGGGVIFSPLIMGFTPVDSLIARSTGLIVGVFSGLIATGTVMRSGLANLKMVIFLCVAFGAAAFTGALSAIWVASYLGDTGEALVRLLLGILITCMVIYFIFGGRKIEWPKIKKSDKITIALNLRQPYYEPSLGKVMVYDLIHMGWLFLSILIVGLISGFFGMGAGWAMVPFQNFIAGAPLKVAAANSVSLVGMGGSIAIWPYFMMGALIPLFAAPWLAGTVAGGLAGSLLLVRIKAGFIRWLLIALMGFSAWGLITRAMAMFHWINPTPYWLDFSILALLFLFAGTSLIKEPNHD